MIYRKKIIYCRIDPLNFLRLSKNEPDKFFSRHALPVMRRGVIDIWKFITAYCVRNMCVKLTGMTRGDMEIRKDLKNTRFWSQFPLRTLEKATRKSETHIYIYKCTLTYINTKRTEEAHDPKGRTNMREGVSHRERNVAWGNCQGRSSLIKGYYSTHTHKYSSVVCHAR